MVFVLKFEHVFTVIQCVSLMVEGTTWPTNRYVSILFEGNHIETTQVGRQHVLRYHHFCFLLNGSSKPYIPGERVHIPPLEKEKHLQNCPFSGDMLVSGSVSEGNIIA